MSTPSNKKEVKDPTKIRRLFPGFPCVLVTVGDNIIPIGMVHVFSFKPLLIGIGVAPERYSHGLLKNSDSFVVNFPTSAQVEEVNFCGEHSGRDIDKFQKTGFTKEPSLEVSAPSIKECPVSLEIKKIFEKDFGDHTWFIGEVVRARVKKHSKDELLLYWGREYRLPGKVIKYRK